MGLYNVVTPCVVGKLHYARPTTAPIEVNDEVAAPLVEAGNLEPYRTPGAILAGIRRTVESLGGDFAEAGRRAAEEFTILESAEAGDDVQVAPTVGVESAPEPDKPAPRPRGRRRSSED